MLCRERGVDDSNGRFLAEYNTNKERVEQCP